MTKEEFIEKTTGIKPEHQWIAGYIEEAIGLLEKLVYRIEEVAETISDNAQQVDELGVEVYRLRRDLSEYVNDYARKQK